MAGWRRDARRLARPPGRSAGRSPAVQFVWSNFVGFELVDIVSAVAAWSAGVVVLRFWKPKDEWRFAARRRRGDADATPGDGRAP